MTNEVALHYYARFRRLNDEPFGRPALAAWNSARSFVHFRERLSESVKTDKRRTRAAKKGWKTRRANQH